MVEETAQTEYEFRNVKHQYFSAIVANIIFLGQGCMIGWMSPALLLLTSEETPFETPLTNEQVSWIGSINALGAIFGTFTFASITMFIGCKRTMLILTFPSIFFWIIIYFGQSYHSILFARLMNGLTAGGVQTTTILYISEIANNNIRGRLSSFCQLSRNVGVLIAYVLGAVLPYYVRPCILIFAPVTFGLLFVFLPNTPQYHLKKGEHKKALASLKYYKGYEGKNDNEIAAFTVEFERLKAFASEQKVNEKIGLKDLTNKEALKGFSKGIVLANLAHLSGIFVFVTYAGLVFKIADTPNIDPYYSSIAIAVMQIIGNLCTGQLSDTLGRKILLYISFLGSACGLLCFALYSYLHQNGYTLSNFQWAPVISLSLVIFTASAGIVPLASVLIVENLPSKIRTVGLAFFNVFRNIAAFYCLKLFPILTASIGLHGCMLILAGACIFGAIYLFFVLEETKGKALDIVQSNGNELVESNLNK